MASFFQELVAPGSRAFTWVEHEGELHLGPFTFPADLPVPVAATENTLAKQLWFDFPYPGRGPVPTGHDEDEETIDGGELLRGLLEGHLPAASPDYDRLVDQVGRCLLILAAFGREEPHHRELEQVIARAEEGAALFDMLLRHAQHHLQEGTHFAEQYEGEAALREFLLARLLLHGAHLVSPTTPGVLYDLGVLCYELARRISSDRPDEAKDGQHELLAESLHYLQLALADAAIREETPAFFLLGLCREETGDREGAWSAYERFLASPASEQYKDLALEVRGRRGEGDSGSPDRTGGKS
ncbi:MAG TPA: hypothetical protein ENI92_02770 [Bacteroidetes bacterium]|nr:hypothetical protein [Bacteroidota bacterium]